MHDIMTQGRFANRVSDARFVRCMEAIARSTNKLISFDLFDTLVIRNVLVPTDVFHYLNEDARRLARASTLNFATQRIKAEKAVCHRFQNMGLMQDPSLEMIYNEFAEQTGVSQAIIDNLVQMEISAEISFCQARKPLQALLQYALQQGKPVIICTDTYLPSAAIKSLVVKTGYPASLRVFASNEIGCTKKHGTLFPHVARELGFASEEILHIGDNANSDVRKAEAAGWKALRLAAPNDQLLKLEKGFPRLFPGFETKKRLPEGAPRYNAGLIVSQSANRHERCIDTTLLDDGDPYDFGYAALGPFVLSLCLSMLRQSKENGIDHLFFLARDGYLPLLVAQRLREALGYGPELSYLPISRAALLPYMLSRPGGIDAVLNVTLDTKKLLSEFVRERFGETAWQIVHDALSEVAPLNPFAIARDYLDAIAAILKKNAPAVIKARQAEIDNLVRYYTSRLASGFRNAVFGVGRKGTFQTILSEISDATVYGFYVVTDNAIDSNLPERNYSSFLGAIDKNVRAKNPDTILYEVFLSERAGPVTGFSAFLEPLRGESYETEDEREFFDKLHAGAIKFAEDAIAQHQSKIYRLEQPAYYAALAIERCMEPGGSLKLLAAIRHEDSLTTSTPRSLTHYFGPRAMEQKEDGWLAFPPKGEYRRIALYCPAMTRIRGGAERVAARLCHRFVADGYEVLVISSGRETNSTTPVYPLPPSVFVRNADPHNVARLSALLGAFQADAGLILASGKIVIPISLAYLQHGIPYLLSERAAPRASFEIYWQDFTWDDYVATHEAASLIGLQFANFAEEYPAHFHGRIWTLPNPIEVPPVRTQPQEKLIACVGRLFLKQKQQHLLIEAFSHVVSDYPDWRLELYGEAYGEDRTFLENLVTAHRLEDRVGRKALRWRRWKPPPAAPTSCSATIRRSGNTLAITSAIAIPWTLPRSSAQSAALMTRAGAKTNAPR